MLKVLMKTSDGGEHLLEIRSHDYEIIQAALEAAHKHEAENEAKSRELFEPLLKEQG